MLNRLALACLLVILPASLAWTQGATPLPEYVTTQFGTPPPVPATQPHPDTLAALDTLLEHSFQQADWSSAHISVLEHLARTRDPRIVWTLVDLQRFAWQPSFRSALVSLAGDLLQKPFGGATARADIIDTMIAWDIPDYPGYLRHKRRVFTQYVPGWDTIFVQGDIAWHLVDWGGVNIDARPFGATQKMCDNCIPAVDNPTFEPAEQATWLKDNDIVFGLVINGQARAYPRRIMEIREMVNDTVGGRDIALPYCTLCGAAQAYFTDNLPHGIARPVMRTTGLLIRSNKVMYDVQSGSVFDTFLGKAVTGPLYDLGLTLDRATVITSDWGSWRSTYPDTTVLTEDLALGRDFNLRNTRDANGPIFPVGDVDPRLPVHEDIIGVVTPDGVAVAFPRTAAVAALTSGQPVSYAGIHVQSSAGGLYALAPDGSDLGSHQAFWFAWSQFHPNTKVWGQ